MKLFLRFCSQLSDFGHFRRTGVRFCAVSYRWNKASLFYGVKKCHLFCDPFSSSTVWSFFFPMLCFIFFFFSLPPLPRSSVACLALWLRVTLSRWPALYWSGSIWLYLLPSFTQLNLIDKQILKMMKTGVVREAFFSSSKSQNGWSLLFCVSLDCFLLFQSYYSWPS